MPTREIQTCIRCKNSKRRCDKTKPSCSRCQRANQTCEYPSSSSSSRSKDPSVEPTSGSGLLTPSISAHDSPEEEAPVPQRVIRKRDRATLSCTRCHRLKVKCDKRQPCCGRCARLGHGRDCAYTHKVQTPPAKGPYLSRNDDAGTIVNLWFIRKRGSSHWRALLSRVRGIVHPHWQKLMSQRLNLSQA